MLTKIFRFSSNLFCFLDSHIFVVLNILFTTPVCPLRLRLLASNMVWTNLPLLVVNEQQIPQRVTAANLKAYKRRVLQPPPPAQKNNKKKLVLVLVSRLFLCYTQPALYMGALPCTVDDAFCEAHSMLRHL